MGDANLKLDANEQGVWLSAAGGDFTQDDVYELLRQQGVRKYDLRALETFLRAKGEKPCKLAPRDPLQEKDAKVVVTLAKDNMTASVLVEPPFFTKPWPTVEEIQEALKQKKVTFGVADDVIRDIIDRRYTDDYTVVARGVPPVSGKNARIELLMDPDKPPEIRADEKIDFWSRSALVNVHPGDEVAVKHSVEPGVDGTTVIGSTLKAPAVKDTDFSFGEGLAKDEDNPLSLVAIIDGQLKKQNGKLVVLPEMEIPGDVDFSVGSIDFTGAVRIKGSVREGFHVIAQGNIDIQEMVEGADVYSESTININAGVRGMGKGTIKADGDINIGFADQATIRSGGTITVKNAILHSRIYAQKSIIVLGGQKSQVAGGRIECGLEFSCQVLGSEMGTRTEVVVGLPPEQLERRRILQAEVAKCTENLSKIDPNLVYLKKLEAAGQLDDQKRSMLMSLTKMKFQLQAAQESMNMEIKDIEFHLDSVRDRGIVRVKETCFPGVQITIRGLTYLVRENCKFTSFVVEDGAVALKPFDYKLSAAGSTEE